MEMDSRDTQILEGILRKPVSLLLFSCSSLGRFCSFVRISPVLGFRRAWRQLCPHWPAPATLPGRVGGARAVVSSRDGVAVSVS
ncbi:unnamed protein product [Protopolystoma xenopodis]|uniref:Uncharacterized protein n=1 Tax=Protopolystoma xenopodis TaxID=117903 RepID=A0A3S5BEM5_9PLAT|nr:unnamed protein product [Protopolystoma xenopodis]